MRISDWSSDVCSSDLRPGVFRLRCSWVDSGEKGSGGAHSSARMYFQWVASTGITDSRLPLRSSGISTSAGSFFSSSRLIVRLSFFTNFTSTSIQRGFSRELPGSKYLLLGSNWLGRSDEHTSELQSLMRIS